jgi:hypothetical protein
MIIPFRFDELFQINQESLISFDGGVVVIDDFFLNYDKILQFVNNANVEIWKCGEESKNFIDYYDCRPCIRNAFIEDRSFDLKILDIIKHFFGYSSKPIYSEIEFNYFKHIRNNVSRDLQLHPHVDCDLNLLVYLDEYANGGTTIYDVEGEIENTEYFNLMYDVSKLKVKKFIPAKPNRCVIFNGKQYHGGHIDQHDVYYENWRINLVRFYERILSGSGILKSVLNSIATNTLSK